MEEDKTEELKKKIEAVLFAAGRKVELEEIAKLCKTKDLAAVANTLHALKQEYDEKGSPLLLTPEGNGWKLTVREKYLPLVREITPHTELAKAILETLAVIAWKHPVLQSEVIKIRSTKAYEHIKELLELGFINKEKKGRSYLLKVTGKFFDYFDLPDEKKAQELFHQAATQQGDNAQQPPTLGGLEVYAVPAEEVQKEQMQQAAKESAEKLGPLEVYEEEDAGETEQQEVEKEVMEEPTPEEQEKTEHEKKEMAEPAELKTTQAEASEETPIVTESAETEPTSSSSLAEAIEKEAREEMEEEQQETAEKTEQQHGRKLSEELEEFAESEEEPGEKEEENAEEETPETSEQEEEKGE